MSWRARIKGKKAPKGWELIEDALYEFEAQLKEAVNEDHAGKRRAELSWKIHRIHWEKNRFIFDLMYRRKVMSKELYDWLARNKIIDAALIAKWRKPGYENLCSILAIQKSNHNFGGVALCRVPLRKRTGQQRISPNVNTGCISCVSGDGKFGGPIWWNTPMDDEEAPEAEGAHRMTWGPAGGAAAGSKRPREEEEEEEMPEELGWDGVTQHYGSVRGGVTLSMDRPGRTRRLRAKGDGQEYGKEQEKDVSDGKADEVKRTIKVTVLGAKKTGGSALQPRSLAGLAKDLLGACFLAGLFGAWYAANIYFNIFNKQMLNAYPHPAIATAIHLAVGSIIMSALWATRLKRPIILTKRVISIVLPLSVLHMAGFLTTNLSLGSVAVSLTHTIKSLEPFFTVMLSWFFLGSAPTLPVLVTLTPIVAGVIIASLTDISFTWPGFLSAMASNLCFQGRNVLSKKTMVQSSLDSLETMDSSQQDMQSLDETNIFAAITIGALVFITPLVCYLDGPALGAIAQGTSTLTSDVLIKAVLAGVCRFVDVLASFAILQRVTPVTHSVGNCVKRVVVIAASILFFKTPASTLNIIGTTLALGGVFAYSMAKRLRPDTSAIITSQPPWDRIATSVMRKFSQPRKYVPAPDMSQDTEKKDDEGKEPEYFL
ncbi:unnamed protein product [Pedinophyceae sp. YPF-701]|nr:unnamed protein product [Pedinophyceae sp. YPF-701]